jgi:ABC-type iron transport system FetAB ATPase subunit
VKTLAESPVLIDRLRITGLRSIRVERCDITVAAGECLAITGPSGAGKSLLLRMIADLDPHEGEAWIDARPRSSMTGPQWRREVVYCAAESGWWHADVGSHFSIAPDAAAIAALGLRPSLLSQEVRLCSTGEKQRLSLLRALVLESPVLLLDEPTGALDAESVARVETLLRQRLLKGTAIIMVTHDPAQAARLSQRRLSMSEGRLTSSSLVGP